MEDRPYHLCADWMGSSTALYGDWGANAWSKSMSIEEAAAEGERVRTAIGFGTMEDLADDLSAAGKYR